MQNVSSAAPDWRAEFRRLEGAYAPATIRSYMTDVAAFEDWCSAEGSVPFPADADTVCQFIEGQSHEKSPSTIRRRLYAIRKIHRLLDLPDPTHNEDVNLSLRRVRRHKANRPRQAKGLTHDFLNRFCDTQPKTAIGLRNRAMLSIGYELLTRRSELVALRSDDLEERADGTFRVLIRRSKSDQYGAGRIAFTSRQTADLLRTWLDVRGPEINWLFCPVYHGTLIDRGLSTSTVRWVIKQAAKRACLDRADIDAFSGHSMRVGAAQDLLKQGFDTAAIMRAGGWKSVNVLARYLEYAEHNVWA